MKIYVAHPSAIPYREELYQPLRASSLNTRVEIILPHETSELPYESKAELQTTQWMIAEVSQASTGVGIEIGWAYLYNVPIIAIHKKGTPRSSSVAQLATQYIEYTNSEELIKLLSTIIMDGQNTKSL